MNDHRLPPDELASAFLDGDLDAEAAEAVRRHPRLAARVRALRRAAAAVGEDVSPPPGAADAAVEAALADFDARRSSAAELAQRRPRSLSVIAGVAAAVAIGFIVAAAVGLFAERAGDETAEIADPAAVAAEAAAAPAPAPDAAPAFEAPPPPADEAVLVPTTSVALAAPEPPPPAAAPQALPEPAPAADVPGGELAEAQAQAEAAIAEAEAARAEAEAATAAAAAAAEEASTAQAEAATAAPPPAPATEPAGPAADDMAALDDAGPAADMLADPLPGEACTEAIGDRTVELRLTVAGTPILILGTSGAPLGALDGTTCADIPPPDGTEMVADEAPDGCAAAIGDGTVELRLTFSGTRILVIRAIDGSLTALDGTTCGGIPAP